MIRVGIDATTWYNDRGFGRFTRELVTALAARGSRELSYTLVIDRPVDREFPVEVIARPTGRTVTEAAVGEGNRSLGDMLRLSRAVKQARFDLFFFPAVYSYFPLLSRTPCVVCFHDTIAERHPELTFPSKRNAIFWNLKSRLAKLQATRVMTVSEASAWDLSMMLGIPRARIDVVTEAADPIFRPRERPRTHPLLVYLGGLNPHKNLIGLLRAWPAVVARRPDVELAIVGDTSRRGFHDNVDELLFEIERDPVLKRSVRLTGYLPDESLVELLASATALVLPSLLEGFGLPAVEAMACGVPVIASRRGSLPEVIGDAGLLFDPLSADDIARAILRLLEDEAMQAELRKRALVRAASFTWSRAAELAEASFLRSV